MGGGSQRHGASRSCERDGPAAIVCGPQRSYLLPKQRQKKRHALTFFGSLVKQRFVNSAFFTLAGTFLQRMKQYFQTGWQQQQYVPRARRVSDSTSKSTGVGDEEIATSSKSPYMSQSGGCSVPRDVLTLDFNGNANSRKRPNNKRHRGQPRKSITIPVEKQRHKRHKNPKHVRRLSSEVNSQASKRMRCRLKKRSTFRKYDKVMQGKLAETVKQRSSGTREESTDVQEEHHINLIKFTQCSGFGDFSTTEKCFSASLSEIIPVSGVNNETETPTNKKKSTRLKSTALFNVKDGNLNTHVRVERQETKSLSRQHVSKVVRPRHASRNCVTSLHPKVWQSGLSFNSNSENVNDWPSLAELERPKSLIKEAATEIVRRKYAGSGVRDAGMLLKDVASVETEQSEHGVDETESLHWSVQGKCTSNASQRTWASVAAQSLAGTVRVTSGHRMSEKSQIPLSETKETSPASNSLSVVSFLKIRKPPIRSKLAYSMRLSGDHSKIKEKPTLGKFMTERQESAKLLKTFKGKHKMSKLIGQKDQSEKRRPRKGEKSDKTQENVAHLLDVHKPKRCWQQIWKVDEMPMVYSCATPPVIVLAEQSLSEYDTRESVVSASDICNSQTNLSAAAANALGATDVHSGISTNTNLLSEHVLSESRDDPHEETIATSSGSVTSLVIKTEIAAPVETEAKSPKKISLRYRALLRSDSSRVDAKTLTEMQTRNRKTNHLRDKKVATRERQRQQRQDRQTTRHDVQRFHTSTNGEDLSQNCEPGLVKSACPYWLRSMPASKEFGHLDSCGDTQSNNEKVQEDESSEVRNTAKLTTLAPCRHSERLRVKAKNITRPTYVP
ncbi:unnamed protein product [Candidula unifasciata]|uniref:Uncharacterized protein n=1 Tax=Candidula unifasciata TaxID=100452 RepID=A0A8S4A2D6_9EUPU|nr:unnamed protein product [Candidula unifasciata]